MPVIRKLVAVVAADVVGYSRLMERDEAGTHERLRKLRAELIDPKIAEHGGRTVKTSGDGMLLEFPSATSALRCAVEIQRELGARNLGVAADRKIEVRIGINLGDIIVEGDDIIGDGVNIAARLETLAEPGGICVASAIWEQVHEDLGVEFIDSGQQHVKNISKPIRVYRVALDKGAHRDTDADVAVTAPVPAGKRSDPSRAMMAAAVIGVLALLGSGVWQYMQRASVPAPTAATASGPPPRSLMVVPLSAPPDDAALGSWADSLTADITRALADSMRDVQVVAPSAAAAHKGRSGDLQAIARDANVRYLVEGDVVPAGNEIAVTMRLVDGATAKQLGSEQRTVARSRLAQDKQLLLARLIFASRDMFDNAERRRIAAASSPPATAHDMVARANWLSERFELNREARKLYDEALRRDPALVAAWIGRADTFVAEHLQDYTAEREPLVAAMDRDSSRALALDDHDPLAWHVRTGALLHQWRYDAAFEANDRARALDPTQFYYARVVLLIFTGRSEEALKIVDERAAMLGRMDPQFRGIACDAHLHLGHYEHAIAECERAAASDQWYWTWMDLTAAYAQTGDATKAAAAKAELLRRVPDFSISRFERKQFSNNPIWVKENREHLIPGWRKAGVPE